jgi:hypothetical protein
MRHLGLERGRIDFQPPPLIGGQAARLQIEAVGRTNTSGGIEQHFRSDAAAIFQDGDGPVVLKLDAGNFETDADCHATVPKLMGEVLSQFVVDEVEQALARFHQSNAYVERAENRCIFDPDHAAADHRQAARQSRNVDDFIAVEHIDAVERHVGRTVRTRADRDHDLIAGDGPDVAAL